MGERCRVSTRDAIRYRDEITLLERCADAIRIRQAHHGIRAHDPKCLDPSLVDRFEQLDRLEPRPGRHPRTAPELLELRAMQRIVRFMCAASMFAIPPTSRPPMALGWPVRENGPIPGRPIRPVSRWQLMMALTLSVPDADWLTP